MHTLNNCNCFLHNLTFLPDTLQFLHNYCMPIFSYFGVLSITEFSVQIPPTYFSFSFPAIASLSLCFSVLGSSYKKSGSSSDDSDCDISPWLSSAPSPSGPSPSHSHTHEASAHTTLVVGKRSIQLHDCDNEGMF